MTMQLDLVRTATTGIAARSVDPGRNVAQFDAVHGPTTLAVLDLPPLVDTPVSGPVVGVFAAGASAGWRRASLLASIDEGVTFAPIGSTALSATMGSSVTALAAGSVALVDRVNSVDVVLLNASMLLSDADDAALLGGANRAMIGDEMLQFGRATPISPGRWRLSEFWRGRRGTEGFAGPHPAGTAFVLVEEETTALLAPAQAVAGVIVMAAGIGDAEPFPQATCPAAGRAVTPLTPVHPTVTLLSGGDLHIGWTRRSRVGWAWRDRLDAPLGEEREAYRVEWPSGRADVNEPSFVFTSAMRAVAAAGGASSVSFEIVQCGDLALSPPLRVAVPIA